MITAAGLALCLVMSGHPCQTAGDIDALFWRCPKDGNVLDCKEKDLSKFGILWWGDDLEVILHADGWQNAPPLRPCDGNLVVLFEGVPPVYNPSAQGPTTIYACFGVPVS